MPELPEVETIVRDLRPELVGRRLAAVRSGEKALRRPWNTDWEATLAGKQVEAVWRRGKWAVVSLSDDLYLLFHMGMTGQLTVGPADAPLASHTHLVFTLDDGRHLRFRDIRRFGSASLFEDDAKLMAFLIKSGLGPEPFDLALQATARAWKRAVTQSRRSLKAILLDQRVVAGVGNIYADESLFEARLHPQTKGCELSDVQARRLRLAVVAVLNRAVERRGSTIRDYVGGSGLAGGFQDEFAVYGRTGEPCRRCGSVIAHLRLAGRSTHYCPRCQRRSSRKA